VPVLLLIVVACHKTPDPGPQPVPAPLPAAAPAPVPPVAPALAAASASPPPAPMLQALASRDDVSCVDIEALAPEPVSALVEVVATVKMPPTVPMRAAGCLVERHAHEIPEVIEGWMKGADTKGLALLAAGRLDALDPELAARFARAAMAGPWATDVQPSLEKSALPEVRAVVGG
jgi:hypothetical protein